MYIYTKYICAHKKKFQLFQNHNARMIFCKICLKVTMPTLRFFKSLDINMVYTLGVYEYIYLSSYMQKKFLWV